MQGLAAPRQAFPLSPAARPPVQEYSHTSNDTRNSLWGVDIGLAVQRRFKCTLNLGGAGCSMQLAKLLATVQVRRGLRLPEQPTCGRALLEHSQPRAHPSRQARSAAVALPRSPQWSLPGVAPETVIEGDSLLQ